MTETKVITDDEGRHRILLQPGDLSFAFGEAIVSATLEVPFQGTSADRDLRLRVYPLDRDWSAADATWNSPWNEPGGDVFRDYSTTIEVPRGSTESVLQIDVSSLVRAMADGDVGMNGFLVTLPDPFGDGLDGADVERLASVANAKLYVDVRRISALGLPREGTRAFFPQIAKRGVKQPAGEAIIE